MRKVIYSMMVSLDGYIEGPNQEIDWHIIDRELHTFINNQPPVQYVEIISHEKGCYDR